VCIIHKLTQPIHQPGGQGRPRRRPPRGAGRHDPVTPSPRPAGAPALARGRGAGGGRGGPLAGRGDRGGARVQARLRLSPRPACADAGAGHGWVHARRTPRVPALCHGGAPLAARGVCGAEPAVDGGAEGGAGREERGWVLALVLDVPALPQVAELQLGGDGAAAAADGHFPRGGLLCAGLRRGGKGAARGGGGVGGRYKRVVWNNNDRALCMVLGEGKTMYSGDAWLDRSGRQETGRSTHTHTQHTLHHTTNQPRSNKQDKTRQPTTSRITVERTKEKSGNHNNTESMAFLPPILDFRVAPLSFHAPTLDRALKGGEGAT
jgi:hypothetical protein